MEICAVEIKYHESRDVVFLIVFLSIFNTVRCLFPCPKRMEDEPRDLNMLPGAQRSDVEVEEKSAEGGDHLSLSMQSESTTQIQQKAAHAPPETREVKEEKSKCCNLI